MDFFVFVHGVFPHFLLKCKEDTEKCPVVKVDAR